MLILKTTLGNLTSTYRDITDGTGVYNSVSNTGGFGAPNVERSNSNLGLVASYKHSDGNQPLVVTLTAPGGASPTTVTGWRVTLTGDGHIKYAQFVAPTYSSLTAYDRYDIIWEPNSAKFYYYNNTVASTPAAFSTANLWVELTDADIVEKSTQTDGDGFYKVVTNDFVTQGTRVCLAQKAVDFSKDEECDQCQDEVLKGSFKITTYLIGAEALASTGNYIKGQVIIEKAQELCGNSSGSCGC